MFFENIKNIDLNNKSSWKNKIFLTFDIDWCSDEVLAYTIDFIEKYDLKATFFITHDTYLLDRMKNNNNIEIGIHPNFNPLIAGNDKYGKNFEEVISFYTNLYSNAESIRSHALTQSSVILNSLKKFGLSYECNSYIPMNSGIVVYPYRHWDNHTIRVPHFWEDDLHCLYGDDWNVENYLDYKGIKVFDFHPIHIFLNTEHIDRYEVARKSFHDFDKLRQYRNESKYGTEDFFLDLIKNVYE